MTLSERNGDLIAAFPVEESDQIMLVTNGGTLIRCPIDDIRIAGRNTQGVTIFKTDDDAKVVSVAHLGDASEDDDEAETEGAVVDAQAPAESDEAADEGETGEES